MKFGKWSGLILAVGFVLGACDFSKDKILTSDVVRIEINPGAALFTQAGESKSFTAQAFDSKGNLVDADISWSSTDPGQVQVDADGRLTALSSLGATQIIAEAEGVKSLPATILIAKPAPDAILISDDVVIGKPEDLNPDQAPKLGAQYKVILSTPSAPAPGKVLIGTGGKAVAGRVVSVNPVTSGFEVILERRPVTEIFEQLSVNLQGSLANVQPDFSATVQPTQIQRFSDGGIQLSYALTQLEPQAALEKTVGPFKCKLDAEFELTDKAIQVAITQSLNFDFVLNINASGVEQLRIKAEGSLAASVSGGVVFGGLGTLEAVCKAKLFSLPIPVSGPLAAILSPVVPIGLKMNAKGELKVVALEAALKGEIKATVIAGVDYTPSTGLTNLSDAQLEPKLSPILTTPNDPQLKVGAEFAFQGTAGIGIGNAIVSLEIIEVAVGPALEASLQTVAQQALDTVNDPSSYSLKIKGAIGPGEDLQDALEFIFSRDTARQLSQTELSLVTELALASSPTVEGDIKASRELFQQGETVNFTVKLDPANLNFIPGVYNVNALQIYRKDNAGHIVMVAEQQANSGQRDFSLSWTATEAGSVSNNFFAFVKTTLLPFAPLELGAVTTQNARATLTYTKSYVYNFENSSPEGANRDSESFEVQGSFQLNKLSETSDSMVFEITDGSISITGEKEFLLESYNVAAPIPICIYNETLQTIISYSGTNTPQGQVIVALNSDNTYTIDSGEQVILANETETIRNSYEFVELEGEPCVENFNGTRQYVDDKSDHLVESGTRQSASPNVLSDTRSETRIDASGGTHETTVTWTLDMQ
ncbi:MAG: hypothetical protein KC422_17830 [Trueperaceae bacterium]|nr:hypothetical protein [Trueperaceae bacterium]